MAAWNLPESLPDLSRYDRLAVDVETHDPDLVKRGPSIWRGGGDVVGIAVAAPDGKRWYLPFAHAEGPQFERRRVIDWAKVELCRARQPKILANAKYDILWLRAIGVPITGPYWDVQIAEPLLDENRGTYALDALAKQYLGEGKDETELARICEYRGYKGAPQEHIWKLPPKYVGPYAEADVDRTLRIFACQEPLLERAGMRALFELETRLVPLLVAMQERGVSVNTERAEALRETLTRRLTAAQEDLDLVVGQHVDVWAAESIASGLVRRGIEAPRTAKREAPSFRQSWLESRGDVACDGILEVRRLSKLLGTFVESAVLGSIAGGRVHPWFNQLRGDEYGTVTGRLSACVAKGTMIEIVRDVDAEPRGRPIEDVRAGDYVYCYDEARTLRLRRVEWSGRTGYRNVLRIHWQGTRNHSIGHLDVTPEHQVRLVTGAYRRADELRPGDRVMALSRSLASGYQRLHPTGTNALQFGPFVTRNNHRVVRVEMLNIPVDVYDLRVEGCHNFIANDICVHNSEPNLQQIPKHDQELGKTMRALFVPDEGHLWGTADYSSIEIRILAHYAIGSGAEEVRESFRANPRLDYHQLTADVARCERQRAKTINFAAVYGAGAAKIGSQLGLPIEEAKAFLARYHASLPFIKTTLNEASRLAEQRGWIKTILGRRRRFVEWEPRDWDLSQEFRAVDAKEVDRRDRAAVMEWIKARKPGAREGCVKRAWTYKALNAVIQGSAADLMKQAMVDIWESGIEAVLGHPLLTVHDELAWSVPDTAEGREAFTEGARLMENAIAFKVPIVVDRKLLRNWGEE